MSIAKLIRQNRTIRRFHQDHPVSLETLRGLVDLARLSASGGNQQPLRFLLSCDPARNAAIFPALAWAAYLKPWPGPAEGERPAAYIVLLTDTRLSKSPQYDAGIACQSMLLGAVEQGLGGCILGAIRRDTLRTALHIPDEYDILLVLALGKPRETVELELAENGNIRYWRGPDDVHHVPKRPLSELIVDFGT
jgi:nitroreductase